MVSSFASLLWRKKERLKESILLPACFWWWTLRPFEHHGISAETERKKDTLLIATLSIFTSVAASCSSVCPQFCMFCLLAFAWLFACFAWFAFFFWLSILVSFFFKNTFCTCCFKQPGENACLFNNLTLGKFSTPPPILCNLRRGKCVAPEKPLLGRANRSCRNT